MFMICLGPDIYPLSYLVLTGLKFSYIGVKRSGYFVWIVQAWSWGRRPGNVRWSALAVISSYMLLGSSFVFNYLFIFSVVKDFSGYGIS